MRFSYPLVRAHKLAVGTRTRIGRRALLRGVAANPAHIAVLRTLQPAFIVDVGANRGQFCLAALSAARPNRIVAFEPLAAPRARLLHILDGHPDVVCHPRALGANTGVAPIHVTTDDDSSSLREGTPLLRGLFPGAKPVTQELVTISTLDDEFETVPARTLLKVDVQGYELEVLLGARRLLPEMTWLVCEVSFVPLYAGQPRVHEIVDIAKSAGMHLTGIVDVCRAQGRVVQADLLFEQHPAAHAACEQ